MYTLRHGLGDGGLETRRFAIWKSPCFDAVALVCTLDTAHVHMVQTVCLRDWFTLHDKFVLA